MTVTSKGTGSVNDVGFSTSFTVNQTPKEVFAAVANPRGWWSEDIVGGTNKLNDVFTYRYDTVHLCKIKLSEVIPGKRIVWSVLENYFNFTEDRSEWRGTKVVFDIAKAGTKTKLTFTHVGLVPEYECFEVCSNAWGSYITGSLRSLITKGKGDPNPPNATPHPPIPGS